MGAPLPAKNAACQSRFERSSKIKLCFSGRSSGDLSLLSLFSIEEPKAGDEPSSDPSRPVAFVDRQRIPMKYPGPVFDKDLWRGLP